MEHQQATGSQTTQEVCVKLKSSVARGFQFTDVREEYEPWSDCSSGDETLSGESTLKRRRDKVSSRETRNIRNKSHGGNADSTSSTDGSESQSWENVSETTSNSDVSEIAIHSLLVEWKQRGLVREMHQDPDRDRYTSDEEGTVVDYAADELEF